MLLFKKKNYCISQLLICECDFSLLAFYWVVFSLFNHQTDVIIFLGSALSPITFQKSVVITYPEAPARVDIL